MRPFWPTMNDDEWRGRGRRIAASTPSEWSRIVATLIRLTGDWDLAEECAQDAFARALQRWPRDGVPANPAAWLTTAARNRAIDRLRRAVDRGGQAAEVAALEPRAGPPAEPATAGSRRPAAADVHLLPPGADAGRAGGADAAQRWPG